MKLLYISPDMAKEWDAFVKQWPNFQIMQSYEWGVLKQAMGWKVIRLAIEEQGRLTAGVQILINFAPFALTSIAYVPRGPLVDWHNQAQVDMLLSAIHREAKKHNAISLKIEPAIEYSAAIKEKLESYNFLPSPYNNQPQCSMLIDLNADEDALLAAMNKTTRYNIRYGLRKGLTVRQGNETDLETFYELINHTAKRAGFPARAFSYYRQIWDSLTATEQIKLFLAEYEGTVIAARMPAIFGNTGATLHSGSLDGYQKLKPNEVLMWESIRWAKKQGCHTYDVWGIPKAVGEHIYLNKPLPEKQNGGLWGVYNFKRGFGGKVIYYVGAYDFVYSRHLHWFMNQIMSRLGSLDKLAHLGDKLQAV